MWHKSSAPPSRSWPSPWHMAKWLSTKSPFYQMIWQMEKGLAHSPCGNHPRPSHVSLFTSLPPELSTWPYLAAREADIHSLGLPQQNTTVWKLKQQKFTSSQSWRLEILDQGVSRHGLFLSPLSLACRQPPSPLSSCDLSAACAFLVCLLVQVFSSMRIPPQQPQFILIISLKSNSEVGPSCVDWGRGGTQFTI